MIGLGIDTGGTCTDAVLFDLEERRVLSTGKTATTKDNLEQGIEAALAMLDASLMPQVSLVSLSTTLATNACVEGRGGRVKLLLIGINPKTVEDSYETYGFSSMDDFVFLPGEPAEGKEPDFGLLEKMAGEFAGCSGIAVSQVFAARNDGLYEKKAKETLERYYDVPIICAYRMFSDLNAIQRGAGAYLNARLIPLIEDFLQAVKVVLRKRSLDVPVYIVRSDGSLMNEAFTRLYPELKQKIIDECTLRPYTWTAPYEGFVFLRSPEGSLDYTEAERRLAGALKRGPLLLEEAASACGCDCYSMETERLEREGVILRFGLTPTDMMHVRGDYTGYDADVSIAAVKWLARRLRLGEESLLEQIFQKVTKRLYIHLTRILLENGHPAYGRGVPGQLLDFVEHTYETGDFDAVHPFFETDLTLIGVGAPTHVFLPVVADKLHARMVLPEHAAVANALGTLAGRISSTRQMEVKFST